MNEGRSDLNFHSEHFRILKDMREPLSAQHNGSSKTILSNTIRHEHGKTRGTSKLQHLLLNSPHDPKNSGLQSLYGISRIH
jgi:hypothetical protein